MVEINSPLVTRLIVVVALCSAFAGCTQSENSERLSKDSAAGNVIPVSDEGARSADITTAIIERRPLANVLHVTGRIQADVSKEIDVSPRFSGRVTDVLVSLGQHVVKGDILAKVDSQEMGDLQAELIEAQSKLQFARAHEERERQVYQEQLERPQGLIAAQSDYEQTKIQMELAQIEYKRSEDLYKEKIASAKDFLRAKAALENLKFEFKEADARLQREQRLYKNRALLRKELQLAKADAERAMQHVNTVKQRLVFLGVPPHLVNGIASNGRILDAIPIISPTSGVVSDQRIAVGEMVDPDKKMMTVTDLSNVIVSADIPEVDVRHIALARPVKIKVAALPDEVFEGGISFISDQVNPNTRTVAIRASLPNPNRKLKSNMFAEIDVPGPDVEVLACPKFAVQRRDNRKVVYVETAGGFEEHQIEIGKEFDNYVEVLKGLKEGDRVATRGALLLRTAMSHRERQE